MSATPLCTNEADEVKNRIIEAAADVYEKKGRQATVEAIAKAAGVSVPVTYQYVKKPADIMLLIMECLQQQFTQRLKANGDPGATAYQRLITAVNQYYGVVDEHLPKVLLIYRGSRALDSAGRKRIMQLEMEAIDVFKQILEDGVVSGEFEPMDIDMCAYDIIMMGHVWALKNWHFRKIELDFDNFLRRQESLIRAMVKKQ